MHLPMAPNQSHPQYKAAVEFYGDFGPRGGSLAQTPSFGMSRDLTRSVVFRCLKYNQPSEMTRHFCTSVYIKFLQLPSRLKQSLTRSSEAVFLGNSLVLVVKVGRHVKKWSTSLLPFCLGWSLVDPAKGCNWGIIR